MALHAFVSRVSMSFSVDETLLPREVNLSTSFREVPSSVYYSHNIITNITIKSDWQQEIPWISLAIHSYHSPLLIGPLDGTQYLLGLIYVSLAGWPTLARPCVGVHKVRLPMSYSFHLRQGTGDLVCITSMVFEMGGKWLHSCCFFGLLLSGFVQDNTSLSHIVPINFFSIYFVIIQVMYPFNGMDTITTPKKSRFVHRTSMDLIKGNCFT